MHRLGLFLAVGNSHVIFVCPSQLHNSVWDLLCMQCILVFLVAPGPVQNVILVFDSTPLSFDPDTRDLNASLNITWLEPVEPNGVISSYTYTLLDVSDGTVVSPSSTSLTQVVTTAVVLPYEQYRVRVVAVTGGGSGDESFSGLERSPQTGVCVCVCVFP